jgi:hypothetical protein
VKLDEIGTYKLDKLVINPWTSINYRYITYKNHSYKWWITPINIH